MNWTDNKCLRPNCPCAGPEQQAHTDHPLRHWDRTCPACIAEGEPPHSEDGKQYRCFAGPSDKQRRYKCKVCGAQFDTLISWDGHDTYDCVVELKAQLASAQSARATNDWRCKKCGKCILQPGYAYGISPDAICHCSR